LTTGAHKPSRADHSIYQYHNIAQPNLFLPPPFQPTSQDVWRDILIFPPRPQYLLQAQGQQPFKNPILAEAETDSMGQPIGVADIFARKRMTLVADWFGFYRTNFPNAS